MKKTRIAIVGLGMASAPHARSLQDLSDRVEVAAVFSPSADRRQRFSKQWAMPAADSLAAIVDDKSIDALLVLTPPSTHQEIVELAARAGKHVLLEKPLEITLERAVEMVNTAEAAGITLAVVLQHRFRPVSVRLREIITQGRLGSLVGASAQLSNWRPQSYYDQPGRGTRARDGGGVLLTQGIHTLDLLISLAGLPVEVAAFAATTPVHRMETEDLVAGALRFENGALGTIGATTCAYPGLPDVIELLGSKGTARIEGSSMIVRFHDGTEIRQEDTGPGGGTGSDPMAFPHDHHRAVLADFIDSVETNATPLISGREALKVHRLIDALLLSATTGRLQHVKA